MSSLQPVRVGILGAASIAPWSMLLPAQDRDDAVVTCIASRDRSRAQALADRFQVPDTAADYAELIGRDDVDLVYNALPVSGHAEWSIRALEAGKAVLCEKPFAMDAAEARSMVAASERTGRPLIEAIHYRYHPVIRRAEQIMRSGVLGRLTGASGEFVYPMPYSPSEIRWHAELGGGAIMDDGCYPIHALRTLLGAEPEVIRARSRFDHGVDAETWATLRFGEIEADIHVSLETDAPFNQVDIRGEAGRLQIRSFITPHWGGKFTLERNGIAEELSTEGPSTWTAQLAHAVEVVRDGATPLSGGLDAVSNMMVIDAVKRAAAQ